MDLRNFTLDEIKQLQKQKLAELIATAGNNQHLAYMLNISIHTINGWIERGRISKAGAKLVEEHGKLGEKFTALELRPDLQIKV